MVVTYDKLLLGHHGVGQHGVHHGGYAPHNGYAPHHVPHHAIPVHHAGVL